MQQRAGLIGSLVATDGGLFFGRDVVRRFMAFDDETGEILWKTIVSGPVSGRGVNQMMPLRPKPPKTLSSLGLTHADAPFSDYPCDSSVSCCAPSDKFRPLRAAARI